MHFSIGGQIYPGEPIVHRPPEDRIFENSRNVSVKLHHRVGRFVKLRLVFPAPPARWILLSEVSFRSEPASTARNYTTEIDGSPLAPTASPSVPAQLPPFAGSPVAPVPNQPSGQDSLWQNSVPDSANGE